MSDTPEKTGTSKVEPPYGADYAKTSRASCKSCKEKIDKGVLRMSIRTPSRHFDGLQDNWFHFMCFWKRAKADNLSEANINKMESLKWDDQENIRTRIAEFKATAVDAPTPKSHIPKIDLAKTSGGKCHECKEKIMKGEVRIQLKATFFHPVCLKKLEVLTIGAEEIDGFEHLEDDKKEELTAIFGKTAKRKAGGDAEETPKKKAKTEGVDDELKAKLKLQTDTFWAVKNDLQNNLKKGEIDTILQANSRFRRKKDGPDGAIEQLADCIIFGVPEICPECEGTLFYSNSEHTYKCSGSISEYTRCTFKNRAPKRTKVIIPPLAKQENEFLATHKFPTLKERYYGFKEGETVARAEDPMQKIKKPRKSTASEKKGKKPSIVKDGCTIDGDCEVAESVHVYVDGKKVVHQATLGKTDLVENKNSYYKIQLLKHDKNEEYYVYRSWGRLGTTQGGFKLEHFVADFNRALKNFKFLFKEKSGNDWEDHDRFEKKPGMMDLLEVEVEGADVMQKASLAVETSTSKLPTPVKHLLQMIFDIEAIHHTMKSMDLDAQKLPLGKLSAAHIKKAYTILSKLSDALDDEEPAQSRILDLSNRFYTMIPHITGQRALPLLDNIEMIREKSKMLDDLLDLQITYSLIKEEKEEEAAGSQKDPFDIHYDKLNCNIGVLDQDSDEFKMIEEYAKKTHGPTHGDYTLKITEIYTLRREEEENQFKKEIGNIHLLWHGSRTTNYAGILSKGLRIAPPEAPVNGYMFGKGIYFADMISKSANYCVIQNADKRTEGLLLLSEVALGEIQEEKRAKETIKKPKKGKNSVKGVGALAPDEKDRRVLEDGIIVPIGKPKKQAAKSELMYNEFIVYQEQQVKMRYLIKAKFVF